MVGRRPALLELDQPVRVGLGGGEPRNVLRPLQGVVAQPAADLDRVVTEIRDRERRTTAVVHRRRQALEDLRLDLLVTGDLRTAIPIASRRHGVLLGSSAINDLIMLSGIGVVYRRRCFGASACATGRRPAMVGLTRENRRKNALVVLSYVVFSVVLFHHLWAAPQTRMLEDNNQDQVFFEWVLTHAARLFTHGDSPDLHRPAQRADWA